MRTTGYSCQTGPATASSTAMWELVSWWSHRLGAGDMQQREIDGIAHISCAAAIDKLMWGYTVRPETPIA